ncbi:MAG: glycosyltransferase family 4 protein [Phormidesmis sp.]
MHVTIIFSHIGNYHIARLKAASEMCTARGWKLTAIQSIQETKEHPWGNLPEIEGFDLETLISPKQEADSLRPNLHPESPEAVAALSPCLDRLQPDVLIIPGWGFPLSQAALRWSQRHRVPAVLMSESKYDDEKRTWWKERLKYWLYIRKYATALVGGPAHKDYLFRLGFKHRIFYGYDAVDNAYFAQQAEIAQTNPVLTRQQNPLIPHKPYFLSVTRLISRKNMLRFVEAFSHYVDKVSVQQAWPLIICGSGEELENIQQLIVQKHLQSLVHFPGFLTYQQIGSWYGLAGAFVHPALVEQWGLVVNEACAAGLPIVCSSTVGACDSLVKDGQNGFTFTPQQTDDITQALLKMHATSDHDRLAMGQHSQQLVSHHGPEHFASGLMQAIYTALPSLSKASNKDLTQ